MKIENIVGTKRALLGVKDASSNFITGLICLLLFQFLLVIIAAIAKVEIADFTSKIYGACVICLFNELGFLITPVVYCKIKDTNFLKDIGFSLRIRWEVILISLGLAIATILFSAPVANYFVAFIINTGYDSSALTSLVVTNPVELIVALIGIALIPAIVEELLFRGMIARGFKRKNIIFGILMSSFFFAIMHGNPLQLVHQFFLGCVCCIVYYLTKQIVPAILIHFTNNAVAIIGAYVLYKNNIADSTSNHVANIIMIIAGLALLVCLVYLLIRICVNKDEKAKAQFGLKNQIMAVVETDLEKQLNAEQEQIDSEKKAELTTPEMIEIYDQTMKEKSIKDRHIERRTLIYALIFGMALWIIQTIGGYL